MRNFDTDSIQGGAGVGATASNFVELTRRFARTGLHHGLRPQRRNLRRGGSRPDFVYRLVSGVVRTTRMLSDGRRQVSGFHFAGDVFGLESSELHVTCAEAITACKVALVKRLTLDRAADHDVTAARELWAITAQDLERMQGHMQLLGRKSAVERLAIFLMEMEARTGGCGVVDLPMPRTDIADYLGVTFETVSRSLTHLEREGLIALPSSRHIELRNRRA